MSLASYQRSPTSTPPEYGTVEPFPGNWAVVEAGTWLSEAGKVTGRCPPGSVCPNSTFASAVPLVWPGDQVSTTPATARSHGLAPRAPPLTTPTRRRVAAPPAETSAPL